MVSVGMTNRTWSERGIWMGEHFAQLRTDGNLTSCQYTVSPHRAGARRSTVSGLFSTREVIDAAMDECERLEREAAERAKTETRQEWLERFCRESSLQEYPRNIPQHLWTTEESKFVAERQAAQLAAEKPQDTAGRSPVAALVSGWGGLPHYNKLVAARAADDLRAAIKAQAELWRKEAAGYTYDNYVKTIAAILERCADELGGK